MSANDVNDPQGDFLSSKTNSLEVDSPRTRNSPLRSSLIRHGARSRSPCIKNVSFSTRNHEKKVCKVNECLKKMQLGSEFLKLRSATRHFQRYFTLDADLSNIRWAPTNKKLHKAKIPVETIKEIRLGRNSEVFRLAGSHHLAEVQDERAFSIIHGENYESLNLVSQNTDDAHIWVTGLMALTCKHKEQSIPSGSLSMATLRERCIASVFDEEDADRKGYLCENRAVKLIKKMNKRLLISRIKHKIKEVRLLCPEDGEKGRITRDQFIEVYKDVATRPEIYFLMVRFANKDYLTCRDLQLFLETEQGMVAVTENLCETIINEFEPSDEAKNSNHMTVDGFTNYLLSDECLLFDQNHRKVHQDMKHPFTHYFIAASHKTYLVEDQLKGPSCVDGYISSLRRSCRFIEMDLWDPCDKDGEVGPIIYNSCSKGLKLEALAALRAINEAAFETSRYPLFIMLQIHLSEKWQIFFAEMLKINFENKLYQPQLDSTDWNRSEKLPTPKDFLSKIILISKSKKQYVDVNENGIRRNEEKNSYGQEYLLSDKLSELICPWAYFADFNNVNVFQKGKSSSKKHLLSINETDCLSCMQNYPSDFNNFSQNQLIRVYPSSIRTDSSNFNPQEFWNRGIQIVALNYQTPGLMMDLQEGRFSDNGACGYILKPSLMREDYFNLEDKSPFPPQILHLRILSCQQLPRPRGSTAKGDSADPYVIVELFGVPLDCAEERTKTIKNDSMNPTFDESFQFQITVPELALIRFLVLDDDFIDDDFIGQYTIPFECLQNGYRHINLLDNEGEPIQNSTLFVHVAVTNRRGGGKAKKRGMSVKRKTQTVNTGMKSIGVKCVDELFKIAVSPLSDSFEMRSNMEAAMTEWQENCGLGLAGTIRQGLRMMHSRVQTASQNAPTSSSPRIQSDGLDRSVQNPPSSLIISTNQKNYPVLETHGILPERVSKSIDSMNALLRICEKILTSMDRLLTELEETTKKISETNEGLAELCSMAGVRGLKAIRASENFAWNVRLLKAQLTLMSKTQTEANDIITQVIDAGCILGILSNKCSSEICSARYAHTSSS